MIIQKIRSVKRNALNADDRVQLAALLVKAGYTVRLGQEKVGSQNTYTVEYREENKCKEQK